MVLLALPLILPLIVVANVVQRRDDPAQHRLFHWLLLLFNLPAFLGGLFLLLAPPELLQEAELPLSEPRLAGLALLLTAVWGLAISLGEVRRRLARWLPLDPAAPVHTLALIFSGYLAAMGLFPLSQGGLEALVETSEATSAVELLAGGLILVTLALAGAGLFIRRDLWKTLERLGVERPSRAQVMVGLRWLPLLLLLEILVTLALSQANPELAETMDELSRQLLADIDTVWEWLLLALAAGVGEEILFRGALQPVLGIWFTSLLFALLHTQYGISLATVLIFFVGVLLGIIRRRTNTTVAILVHAAYNFVLGLFALLASLVEETATWLH